MRSIYLALIVISSALFAAGCGKSGGDTGTPVVAAPGWGIGMVIHVPQKWIDEIISHVVGWLEDGTGIDLEKGDVKIASQGARRSSDTGGHISDFKITVNYRKTEFTSTPKDIPCNVDGIPTEEGTARIKESVEQIKQQIRALR